MKLLDADFDEEIPVLMKHKEVIEERLTRYYAEFRYWAKYEWSARYHNFYCRHYGFEEKVLDIVIPEEKLQRKMKPLLS